MNIQIKALLASFIGTIILGIIVIPILRKMKIGQVVRDDGPQSHLKKSGTPTMGGIIMLVVIFVISAIVSTKYPSVLPVALVTLGYGLIGFIDDFIKLVLKNPKGLKPSLKMLGLIIVAVAFVVYLVHSGFGTETYIPFLRDYIVIPTWAYIPCMVFIILACTNSLNLTDGLDGLASGITAIIMIFFTYAAAKYGNKEMSVFSSIVVGSTIGFLLFNMYPAKVFMGDTGSLSMGATLATVAIITDHEVTWIVVMGVFIIETLSVIIQTISVKFFNKKVFLMTPLHHHFEKLGWQEQDIVKMFWVVGLILGMISIVFGVWI